MICPHNLVYCAWFDIFAIWTFPTTAAFARLLAGLRKTGTFCWKCQLRSDKFNGLQTEMPVEPKAGGQIQENIRDLTFVGLFWIELRKSRQPRRQRSCQPPIVLGPLPVRGGAP